LSRGVAEKGTPDYAARFEVAGRICCSFSAALPKEEWGVIRQVDPPLFHNVENDLKAIVQTASRASGCERYVVVVKGMSGFAGTNQIVKGIGILNRGIVDRFSTTYLFAITVLYVFDGRSIDILKKGVGGIADEDTLVDRLRRGVAHETPIQGPSRKLDDFTWPPAPDAVTLREPTRALLTSSLDVALPRLLAP
jgi:hypothetical protein